MGWSQESVDIIATVLRNSLTVGRVVAFDVDVDAVREDALPADASIEAVLYRRDEGSDARQGGAVAQHGSITRIAGGDGPGDEGEDRRRYRVRFDAPGQGTYQIVLRWPSDADDHDHYEALALPESADGLLRVR